MNTSPRFSFFAAPMMLCACLAALLMMPVRAQDSRAEYRAFWVDTFNTALNNHADIVNVVNNAKAANANAIFAQVRRRGDAWYLNSLEPPPDFTPIGAGFDPLQDLITEAHKNGIEVHAFVIMGAIWNKNPTFAPTATLGPPTNPNHVFNLHGGYDPITKRIVPGPNNWLTRTLLPDSSASRITFQGHRFGLDFWLDFGHPDAAADSVDVLMHLVSNYDIDGLHLDRIRYPELDVTGQTPTTGANIGYNETSVARFQARYGIVAGSPPAPGDALWAQWRRDQVTNLVRRVYLNAIAVKPQMKVSAALIAFGGIGATESAWNSAEAYWRVYQDWRAWTEEGILDIAIPMNYKREHIASQATQYDQWNEWTKDHQYNRSAMIGQGAFLNAIEGTLRQTRRALAPSAKGNSVVGIIYFSMANSNSPATNGVTATPIANPFSIPPNQVTLTRPYAEFASALTTGKSVNGATLYEDPAVNPIPIFAQPATIPVFAWKVAPTVGHVMGFAKRADGTPLDTATVTIENLTTHEVARTTATDGGGFYGVVDLAPGEYFVKAELGADVLYSCAVSVTAGAVTTADLAPETSAPVTTATLDPAAPNGSNDWYTSDVTVSLAATDSCAGAARTEYSLDGGATWLPYTGSFLISSEGTTVVSYRSVDRAGNVEATQSLTIRIDKTAPIVQLTATPSIIWPPNGKLVTVTISGTAFDATSGLAGVSYVVTDEYGMPLSIAPRTLSGNSATWIDTLGVEARRDGHDRDGRLYRVTAIVTDIAGNSTTTFVDIVVPHDRRGR